jgi:hypothetical protein
MGLARPRHSAWDNTSINQSLIAQHVEETRLLLLPTPPLGHRRAAAILLLLLGAVGAPPHLLPTSTSPPAAWPPAAPAPASIPATCSAATAAAAAAALWAVHPAPFHQPRFGQCGSLLTWLPLPAAGAAATLRRWPTACRLIESGRRRKLVSRHRHVAGSACKAAPGSAVSETFTLFLFGSVDSL